MVKTSVLVCIDSDIMKLAKEKLKGQVSRICNEALRKELALAESSPDELAELESLLEVKANVQRLSTQEGGATAIRIVAQEVRKARGNPQTIQEKLSFWSAIYKGAKLALTKEKLKEVSPAPPSLKGAQPKP